MKIWEKMKNIGRKSYEKIENTEKLIIIWEKMKKIGRKSYEKSM